MPQIDWKAIAAAITEATKRAFTVRDRAPVSGGSINAAYRVSDGERAFFVKLNRAPALPTFEAEWDGLSALADAKATRVPGPVAHGVAGDRAYLILEWLTLHGRGRWEALGEGLARLHRVTAKRFGWEQDNFLGGTAQPNGWHDDWAAFFATQRLGYQLQLAERNGAPAALLTAGERLQQSLSALFDGYRPMPSLLHGDLWSGNIAFDNDRAPVLFDPAVHYGDRECDLAMSELFGRLPDTVYAAYAAVWPLDAGYPVRRELYQLYHILNHFNLFGGTYADQALRLTQRLLAACKG